MSAPNEGSGSPRESIIAAGPPYPPRYQGLGGSPSVIPDVPISAVFLALYLIFGIIHIRILKSNKSRGHKFLFNGAILGLCKVRVVTMSLRMAWAAYPRNTSLGIAANTFVYAGTIIIFIVNWFFVQRIIRAQHSRLGWSTPYRIFHRAGFAILIITLLLLIIGNIWQYFTINDYTLHVLRILVLIGQTYFTVFALAPAVLVAISLLIPRRETEKFGAGRLRINITILLLAVTIISAGQIFRCIIAWIPQTPMREQSGRPLDTPWYLSKACFYCFNFVTEIIVIIIFAVVRVDLRFHIPNGSRMSGDYSYRNSRVTLPLEKNEAAPGPIVPTIYQNNGSNSTLHLYNISVFEDSKTLADSLKYGASTLEVDQKTGHWKVKRVSTGSTSSRASLNSSSASPVSSHDRTVRFGDEASIPPVPIIPDEADWPSPATPMSHNSLMVMEQGNASKRGTSNRQFELSDQALNGVDMNDAITDALSKLEHHSEKNGAISPIPGAPLAAKSTPPSPPPEYNESGRISIGAKTPLLYQEQRTSILKNPLAPRKRATYPPKPALKIPNKMDAHDKTRDTPIIDEEAPAMSAPSATAASAVQKPRGTRRPSSLELITLSHRPSTDSRRILDMSLQGDKAGDVSRPDSIKDVSQPQSIKDVPLVHMTDDNAHCTGVERSPSSVYSRDIQSGGVSRETSSAKRSEVTTSSDAREVAIAEEEFKRFSSEAERVDEENVLGRK